MFEQVEDFHRPASVREAVRLLESGKGRARIVAGGTDLVVDGDSTVRALIDITHSGIAYIRKRGGSCAIGAATTMAELEESRIIRGLGGGILARAAATCGSIQIRGVATVGGNLANGSPAADLVTPLLVLDAVVVVADAKGRRKLPIAEYLAVRGARAMRQSLLVEVTVPRPLGRRCGWSFQKLGRTALDISVVNVAAGLQVDAAGRIQWARLALGAVAPTAIRAGATEKNLRGRGLDAEAVAEAAEGVMREVSPITDLRASATYRREMCRVLTRRALVECAAQAGCAI
ncbi:MAG: FAD binding domain-containing protein [Bryobacteraceae bacterium]|jgi:carbon-monoxide dehydrogenase medium subunit